MWETLKFGAISPINLRQLENAVNRNQLLTVFYMGIPGPKMIWQFGEFGYDVELNNDRLAIKPTKWEYLNNPERMRLFKLHQEMIELKDDHIAFNKPSKTTLSLESTVKSITLEHPDMDVVIHGNFGLSTVGNIPLSFPKVGKWYNYFTGEELSLTSTTNNFNLRSSEFMLFTSKPLPKPESGIVQVDFLTAIPEEITPEGEIQIYPVPTKGRLVIEFPEDMSGAKFRVADMAGRVLFEGTSGVGTKILELDVTNIQAGIYIFEAYDHKRVLRRRFIKE